MKNKILAIGAIALILASCQEKESLDDFVANILRRMPEMTYKEFHSYYITKADLVAMQFDPKSPLSRTFMEKQYPYLDNQGILYKSNVEFRNLIFCDSKYLDPTVEDKFKYEWKKIKTIPSHAEPRDNGSMMYFFEFTDGERTFDTYIEFIRYEGKIYLLSFNAPKCKSNCVEPIIEDYAY